MRQAASDTFGIAGLAAALNDRFQLLMQGRRTALPRHRTLSATLDWSYDQLPGIEQLVLRRLAVFVGSFTMDAASAVLAHADMSSAAIVDAIANLVAKSLVSADVSGSTAFYRLFDVTRAYALTKLEESAEREGLARSHAEYYRGVLEKAQADWETSPATEWLDRYRHLIDNVRAALDWAFSPAGDPATGVAITVGSGSAVVRAVADERMRRTRRSRVGRRPPQAGAQTARCASTPRRPGH